MDYFIKAESKAQFDEILIGAGLIVITPESQQTMAAYETQDDNGDTITVPESVVVTPESRAVAEGFALDEIGVISKPTGATITQGDVEYPEYAPIPGYHANLRGELTEEQQATLATILLPDAPSNPARVWA
mgnify:CR=1 FL=1